MTQTATNFDNKSQPSRALSSTFLLGIFVVVLCGVVSSANAEDAARPAEPFMSPEIELAADNPVRAKGPDEKKWKYRLNLGATAALGTSTNVVGQQNGISATLGGRIDSGAEYSNNGNEWRNSLSLDEAFTMTPPIDTFVKAIDRFSVETMYMRRNNAVPWLGPFARLQLDMAIFPGYDVREGGGIHYVARRADGSDEQHFRSPITADTTKKKLSDAGLPLTLRESIGAFARPLDDEALRLEFRVGLGALQTFAEGQLAVDDDDTTNPIELIILDDAFQSGPVASIELRGALAEKGFTYYVLGEVMTPAINNQRSTDTRNMGELTNWLVEAGFSLKLVSWASLDYKLTVYRQPQVFDKVQMTNNLLLVFSYSVFDSEEKPEEAAESSDGGDA